MQSMLTDSDYDALAVGLRRSRLFHEVGTVLSQPGSFQTEFTPTPAP